VQQPPDQRAFAIVHASSSRKAQHLLSEMRLKKFLELYYCTHQK
jgi:hypothetical protein